MKVIDYKAPKTGEIKGTSYGSPLVKWHNGELEVLTLVKRCEAWYGKSRYQIVKK